MLRHPVRLALELVLIAVTCTWPTTARADPPTRPGSEVIDPWAPAALARTRAAWRGPDGNEVVDPWRGVHDGRATRRPAFVVDPWQGRSDAVPTAVFPPLDVIDPWAR